MTWGNEVFTYLRSNRYNGITKEASVRRVKGYQIWISETF